MFQMVIFLSITLTTVIFLYKTISQNKIVKGVTPLSCCTLLLLSLSSIHIPGTWILCFYNLLIILIYNTILEYPRPNNQKTNIFKSGLGTGLLILMNYELCVFYIVILYSLLYYKVFTWKNFNIQLIGFLIPSCFYFSLQLFSIKTSAPNFTENIELRIIDFPISHSILFFITFLSLYELYYNFFKKNELVKKAFFILFIISICISVSGWIFNETTMMFYLITPITILIINYLIYTNYKIFRTFLVGLLMMSFLFEIIQL